MAFLRSWRGVLWVPFHLLVETVTMGHRRRVCSNNNNGNNNNSHHPSSFLLCRHASCSSLPQELVCNSIRTSIHTCARVKQGLQGLEVIGRERKEKKTSSIHHQGAALGDAEKGGGGADRRRSTSFGEGGGRPAFWKLWSPCGCGRYLPKQYLLLVTIKVLCMYIQHKVGTPVGKEGLMITRDPRSLSRICGR